MRLAALGTSRATHLLARGLAAAVGVYLGIAYLVLPSLWRHYESQPGLAALPMVTRTPQGIPGDPINVGIVGSKREVIEAFATAGWHPADPITLRSSIDIGLSVVLDRSDPDAPVSTLMFLGREQDLAFERADGTSADRRHHVRLWLTLERGAEGRPVWLGSASFDRGVGLSHDTGQITHHIGADLDKERDFLIGSLAGVGMVEESNQVAGVGPTIDGRNGGGDPYFTDGEVTVAVLRPEAISHSAPPATRPNPASVSLMQWIWRMFVVGWLEADGEPRVR